MTYKMTFNNIDSAINTTKLFELRKQSVSSVMLGKYRDARAAQKEFAKIAVEDFDACKAMPIINVLNIPFRFAIPILFRNIGFRIFNLFSRKTPEEKQLRTMYKAYRKEASPEEIQKRTVTLKFPYFA